MKAKVIVPILSIALLSLSGCASNEVSTDVDTPIVEVQEVIEGVPDTKIEPVEQTAINTSVNDAVNEVTSYTITPYEDTNFMEIESSQADTVLAYIDETFKQRGYTDCAIIESFHYENYECVHMVFDDVRYICITVDDGTNKLMVLYDCVLTQSLIDNWEYN